MSPTTDPADEPGSKAHGGGIAGRVTTPRRRSKSLIPMPKLGVWSWSFVGVVAATIIVVVALAAVSEIVLPMTFAAVLAVIFKPLAGTLQRHRWKPSLAAGIVVLCLLAVAGGVVVATVRGVTEQADQISAVTEGTDAQAQVSVRLEENGRTVTGKASDTDTMVAAAYAYVNALNKLLVKREKQAPEALTIAR